MYNIAQRFLSTLDPYCREACSLKSFGLRQLLALLSFVAGDAVITEGSTPLPSWQLEEREMREVEGEEQRCWPSAERRVAFGNAGPPSLHIVCTS